MSNRWHEYMPVLAAQVIASAIWGPFHWHTFLTCMVLWPIFDVAFDAICAAVVRAHRRRKFRNAMREAEGER